MLFKHETILSITNFFERIISSINCGKVMHSHIKQMQSISYFQSLCTAWVTISETHSHSLFHIPTNPLTQKYLLAISVYCAAFCLISFSKPLTNPMSSKSIPLAFSKLCKLQSLLGLNKRTFGFFLPNQLLYFNHTVFPLLYTICGSASCSFKHEHGIVVP